jgi:acyl dehydratase
MVTIDGVAGLVAAVGSELGISNWLVVDQAVIDQFAVATGDDNWIHIDPARAAASPYGSTIAHGLLTLSLGPRFCYELFAVDGIAYGVNYGFERIRFPGAVPVNSRVRMSFRFIDATVHPDGVLTKARWTFEREGAAKPVCVADHLSRYFTA